MLQGSLRRNPSGFLFVNDKYRSFLVSYVIVPILFYTADGLLHSGLLPPNDGIRLLLIQIGLPVVGWFTFRWLLENKLIEIGHPLPAAWGASVGLVHWFPVYFKLAALFIWEPVGGKATVDDFDILLFLVNFIFPAVTFSGSTYDGTLLVIPLTMLLFFRAATKKIGSSRFLDFGI